MHASNMGVWPPAGFALGPGLSMTVGAGQRSMQDSGERIDGDSTLLGFHIQTWGLRIKMYQDNVYKER